MVGVLIAAAPVAAETPYALDLPRGFPPPNIPADNLLTWEKVELGRFLFYDARLSGNQTFACASCHQQSRAFTDGLPHAMGSTGEAHPRGSMSIANVAYAGTLAWAGPGLFALEAQALRCSASTRSNRLAGKENELDRPRRRALSTHVRRGVPDDDPFSIDTITKAIASFERTLISGNSPYDRYALGLDDNAISASAKRGEVLFFDADFGAGVFRECSHCHGGFNFTASVDHAGTVAERPMHNNALYNLRCADFGLPNIDLPQCDTVPPATQCEGTGPQAMGCYPPDNTGAFGITGSRDMASSCRRCATSRSPGRTCTTAASRPSTRCSITAGGRPSPTAPTPASARSRRGLFIVHFDLPRAPTSWRSSTRSPTRSSSPIRTSPIRSCACLPRRLRSDGTVAVNELVAVDQPRQQLARGLRWPMPAATAPSPS